MKALTLVALMTAVSGSQTGSAAIPGLWTAQFEGQTFIRLELASANGTMTGSISLGNIEVDERGALRRVDAATGGQTPIFDVTLRDSVLTFSVKESSDTDRFEFRLLEAGHGELAFLLNDANREELAASGIPVPRPVALAK
jgi:hypothetical protein